MCKINNFSVNLHIFHLRAHFTGYNRVDCSSPTNLTPTNNEYAQALAAL